MAKNIKRMLAMVLVMCMFVSALPMQALAADGDGTVTSTETSPEGLQTNVSTTTNGTGTPTVTVTITKDTDGTYTDSEGKIITVDRAETQVTVTEKNQNGDVLSEDVVYSKEETHTDITIVDGNSTSTQFVTDGKETSREGIDLSKEDVKVDIPLTEGEKNSVTFGDPAGTETVTGDVPEGENDPHYDYTKTTILEQGKVTVSNEGVNVEETFHNEDTKLDYVHSDATPNGENDLVHADGHAPEHYLPGYEGKPEKPEIPEGYDYVYVGSGNTSKVVPAIVFTEPLSNDDKLAQYGDDPRNGAYIYYGTNGKDEDGVSYYTSYFVSWLDDEYEKTVAKTADGKYVTDEEGYVLDIHGNRMFKNEWTTTGPDNKTLYLHRFDNPRGASMYVEGWYEDGEWVKELNGSNKYNTVWAGPQQFVLVDSEGNAITTYCADFATPTQDYFAYNMENLEQADYYSDEDAKMIRTIANNGYWGNNEGPGSLEAMKEQLIASDKFTEEELESLTDGVALTVTQMAIWTYSNKMSSLEFVNAFYSNWGTGDVPEDKEDEVKLLFKLYDHLTSLPGTDVTNTTADTVITADTFVDDLSVTVIDMVKDHANNQDNDTSNDAYTTKVTFSLVVAPSEDNDGDDLVAYLLAADGKTILASGRIAGDGPEEEFLPKDDDGNYYFNNITMIEGEQNFQLNLSGVQHLQKGVYLYTSEVVGEDQVSSQTMVGLASGSRGVDVTMNITFDLDVEGIQVTERVWHDEGDPVVTTHEPPPEEEEVPPPAVFRLNNQTTDLQEIPEEPVPLAAPVVTGDNSFMWLAVVLVSLMALVAINVFDKKNQYEAF